MGETMRKDALYALAVAFASSGAIAAETCQDQQTALNGVGAKYKPQFEGYQKEGDDLKKDASVEFNFDVTWDNVDIIFGMPTVTVRDQDLIFGVPQVTMRTQEMIFHTPSVRMERRKTGEYPEIVCDHAFIPSCTVHWSPIYIDVPVPFMQEQRVKLDIPEFTFADTRIRMGIPEFSIVQTRWVIGLPQFKLTSVYLNSGQIRDRSEALQKRVGTTRTAMTQETAADIHALYDCQRSSLVQNRNDAGAKFTAGLNVMDAVIQSLRAQGADPSKMPDGSDMTAKRAALEAQRTLAMAKFDDALDKLNQSEKDSIASLGGAGTPAGPGAAFVAGRPAANSAGLVKLQSF
jgi:hypothetical protein